MTSQPPDPQELADQINQLVEQLTGSRDDALGDARSLQLAGQSLMDREEKRLARKLGPEHPRVQQLRQRRETMLATARRLEAERQLADIRPPEVDESEALVQGRVIDELGQGISGLQVQLMDANGKPLASKPAATDRSGYYGLIIDAGQVKGGRAAQLTVNTSTGRLVYRSDPLQISEVSRITLDVSLDRFKLSQTSGGTEPGGQPGEPPKPGDQSKPWVVSGSVIDQQGNPLAGLTVQVASREIKLDKSLGDAATNRQGKYQIRVVEDPAIEGLKPGIQLTILVIGPDGQQLYVSDKEILFIPGEEVTLDIQINRPGRKVKGR